MVINEMINAKRNMPNCSAVRLDDLWCIKDFLEGGFSYINKPWFLERVNRGLAALNPDGEKTKELMNDIGSQRRSSVPVDSGESWY